MEKRQIAVVSDHMVGSKSANAVNVREMAKGFSKFTDLEPFIVSKTKKLNYDFFDVGEVDNYSETSVLHQHLSNALSPLSLPGLIKTLKKRRPALIYARSQNGAMAAMKTRTPFVLETHKPPNSISGRDASFFSSIGGSDFFRGVVTISPILSSAYQANGIPADKLRIIADPVDTELFEFNDELAKDTKVQRIVFYAGHLYPYKGVGTILEAARRLPNVEFRLAGGLTNDIRVTKNLIAQMELKNTKLLGWMDRKSLALEMRRSQVLCLPNESWHESSNWTSPMKLGEYLATGNPIVLSDISAHRYWIGNTPVTLFGPGDGDSLAQSISNVLEKSHSSRDAFKRRELAEDFSLQTRISKILDMFGVN